ncbi:sulfite oxidase, mitochondrial [Plutella xylostella]|uniref:sulfite oxidase, mitochondrial n=1 Tax=Plutella xylostella TaxID=51655 RepID=UPI002032C423|nr:sulfite oxidase, mitochondrial [Plutella xylostella]
MKYLVIIKLSTTGKESSGGSADSPAEAGARRPDLPTFRADEVSQHDNKKSFWVIYKNGVYDVTKFLVSHPGGEQIMNAGGLSIEPFWNVYGMHHTKQVYEVLESYRIGNLHEDDIVDHSNDELWAKEPYRRKELIVKTAKPFNAEVPPKIQVDHFDTPNDLFFVRQHMAVPELDPLTHRVTVTVRGEGGKAGGEARSFSMEDLDKFPQVTVRAALMCAGNRRSEMNKVKPVKGIEWGGGAISNAVWGGVYLRDVLIHCGVSERDVEGKHVVFNGADLDATGHHFSTSMPLHMVMDPRAKVLLARTMNGEPLPRDHGCPLRVLVPGAPAVRSVKWLESITVSTEESKGHWHTSDYRSLNPSVTWETVDFASAPPLYSLPVTSYICDVKREKDELVVRGYAYSGGGARIVRVDISTDRGASWRPCACAAADPAPPAQHYAWLLWTARVPAGSCSEVELWVKATDSNFNTQPETFDNIWNIRGVLSNAYHRVKVQL